MMLSLYIKVLKMRRIVQPEEEVTTLGEREVMLRKVLQVCLICLKNLF